ncbi:MAG: biotin/lipoyl-containing protein [Promethearchaeota archaeon]
MTRKYKLTINNKTINIEVDGPTNGILSITIGESTFPVQVTDTDSDSGKYKVTVGDSKHTLQLTPQSNARGYSVKVDKDTYTAQLIPLTHTTTRPILSPAVSAAPAVTMSSARVLSAVAQEPTEPGTVTAPLPGRVLEVRVIKGASIKAGDVLLVLEAMKMANEIRAPQDGTVKAIHVKAGTTVEKGQPMLSIT